MGMGLPPVKPSTGGSKKECSRVLPACPQPGHQKPETRAGNRTGCTPEPSPQARGKLHRTRDTRRRGALRRVSPRPALWPAAVAPPSCPRRAPASANQAIGRATARELAGVGAHKAVPGAPRLHSRRESPRPPRADPSAGKGPLPTQLGGRFEPEDRNAIPYSSPRDFCRSSL